FDANGVSVAWIRADGADEERTLVYFHGGGFLVGSVTSHAELMWHLSRVAHCRVLGVDYRCVPEFTYPAPIEDALAVHRFLVEQGFDLSRVAYAGDSAGANVVLNLLLRLRDQGRPSPAGAV